MKNTNNYLIDQINNIVNYILHLKIIKTNKKYVMKNYKKMLMIN